MKIDHWTARQWTQNSWRDMNLSLLGSRRPSQEQNYENCSGGQIKEGKMG